MLCTMYSCEQNLVQRLLRLCIQTRCVFQEINPALDGVELDALLDSETPLRVMKIVPIGRDDWNKLTPGEVSSGSLILR